MCTRRPLALTISTSGCDGGITLATRYGHIGRSAEEDPPGRRLNYDIPYSIGIVEEVAILDRAMEFRVLRRNTQLGAHSLNDIWQWEFHFPMFAANHNRPSLSYPIVIFGGWKRWGNLIELNKGVKEDALWPATPRGVWELASADIFGNSRERIPDAPTASYEPNDEMMTGGRSGITSEDDEYAVVGMAIPDLARYYGSDGPPDAHFRTGGRNLDPSAQLPHST